MGNLNNPDLGSAKSKKEKEKKDKLFDVHVTEFEQFPNFVDCGLISSRKLSEIISDAMSSLLPDFKGCYIAPAPNGQTFDVRFYFDDKGEDVFDDDDNLKMARIFKTEQNGPSTGSNTLDTIKHIVGIPMQKLYNLTPTGKEFLSKFIFSPTGNIQWDQHVREEFERSGYNVNVYGMVYGLDLFRLLPFVFGYKDKKGTRYDYQVNVIKQTDPNNWLFLLWRASQGKADEIGRELGFSTNNSIYMVRPSGI